MPSHLYALLIGINDYAEDVTGKSRVNPLCGPLNDVDDWTELLRGAESAGEFALELLTLTNAQATRAAIITAIRDHLGQARAGDSVLLHFSGHGSREPAPPSFAPFPADGLHETLVCHDSRLPGGFDLADKELGYLIAQIACHGAHVLCVLDCCHSGSGTRSPTVVPRQVEPRLAARAATDYIASTEVLAATARDATCAAADGSGRHVLLAGCRATETAKEMLIRGTWRGIFTATLLSMLRRWRGRLTYRQLQQQLAAEATLHGNGQMSQQTPQLELCHADDLDGSVLTGLLNASVPLFRVHWNGTAWQAEIGALHGVRDKSDTKPTRIAVLPTGSSPASFDSPLVIFGAVKAYATTSTLERIHEAAALDVQSAYFGWVTDYGESLPIHLADDDPDASMADAYGALRAAIDPRSYTPAGALVSEVPRTEPGAYTVVSLTPRFDLRRSSDGASALETANIDEALDVAGCVAALEHIARWERVAAIVNAGSGLHSSDVGLIVTDASGGSELSPQPDNGSTALTLRYVLRDGEWHPPQLRIAIRNRGTRALHCALLLLSEDFSITSTLIPSGTARIDSLHTCPTNDGTPLILGVPDFAWERGRTSVIDRLKLIACTVDFDARAFDQPSLGQWLSTLRPNATTTPRARRAQRAMLRPVRDDDAAPRWLALDLLITTDRSSADAQTEADATYRASAKA
jgi:hypothetical protein